MEHHIEYSISVSDDGNYVVLKFKGEIRGVVTLHPAIQANELAMEQGIMNILVDLTEAQNKQSVLETHRYVRELVAKDPRISRGVRYAMLVRPDDHSHDFTETAAINAGFALHLFRRREQAENYLLENAMRYSSRKLSNIV